MRKRQSARPLIVACVLSAVLQVTGLARGDAVDQQTQKLDRYVAQFNADDRELYKQAIPNDKAGEWMRANVPRFECPDAAIERTYYFRYWTFRKHLKKTDDGWVITEFLPAVYWAGKHNTINDSAIHHFREGRWLADKTILDDYATFWLRKGGAVRSYSLPLADAIWARTLATGDDRLGIELLPDLVQNDVAWNDHRDANGLYWQHDDRDAMEMSISGTISKHGYRATINSYMYGDALAIAELSARAGKTDQATKYREKAAELKRLTQEKLWNSGHQFFEVLTRTETPALTGVRELHGYTPWYFDLPDADKSIAWKQLMDPQGFFAPYGPTTAEQRAKGFTVAYTGHECQWNGPSWPFSTSITLTALANLLNDYDQNIIQSADYFRLLKIYTDSQQLKLDDGRTVPWIDENLNPYTGDWISRTRLKTWENGTWSAEKGGEERGKDYNHSTYADLIITGLIGLRPRADDLIEINPLVPPDWPYFKLDRVPYHGHMLSIVYDPSGTHYNAGPGLQVFSDGQLIGQSRALGRMKIAIRPK